MSHDSDIAEMGRALQAAKKERHAKWHRLNMAALTESGLPFREANCGESVLFREPGMPKVDFFPSTGRWRVAGVKKTFRGGAKAFVKWYLAHKKLEHDPITGGKHGDTVCVFMPGFDAALYRLEERTVGPWPEKKTDWFLCIDGRFPSPVSQFREWGARFKVISA